MDKVYRLHYRAQLKEAGGERLAGAVRECEERVRGAQGEERILTAALYYYGKLLFLYYEAVGRPLEAREPWDREADASLPLESGEDIQAEVLRPEVLLAPLAPFLQTWPGQNGDRQWVHMYHIYYHSMPKSASDWRRSAVPQQRRGRIAFLREEKLFSYVFYHKAIVDEGLLKGDRYQSIALHENILFSYFEEPKQMVNVLNDDEHDSKVIEEWTAVDPESHFIRMPEGNGGNFLFLPAYFALGEEDGRESV